MTTVADLQRFKDVLHGIDPTLYNGGSFSIKPGRKHCLIAEAIAQTPSEEHRGMFEGCNYYNIPYALWYRIFLGVCEQDLSYDLDAALKFADGLIDNEMRKIND